MADFSVSEAKRKELAAKMAELGIKESDIVEKFIRGSGAGGQKINKTASCVYLFHEPTGLEVKCQRERSQALNRFLARRELCRKIENIQKGQKSAQKRKEHKIKKQKQRRSRRSKAKLVEGKRRVATVKAGRRAIKNGSE